LVGTDSRWDRVELALMALAVDPSGLKGLWLRARTGAVRDRVVAALSALPLPMTKLHPSLGDEALYGGLDITATLAAGRPVRSAGLLARPAALVLTMAERCPAGLAARLGQALDTPGPCLVALDEGVEAEEALPPALADRLALFLTLDGIADAEAPPLILDATRLALARARLGSIRQPALAAERLAGVAFRLGIAGLRAPLLALRLARVIAALRGHAGIRREDILIAAELAYAHRATVLPEPISPEAAPPPETPESGPTDAEPAESLDLPEELILEAVRAALPADLLDRLAAARAARALQGGTGSGEARTGHRRGRPLPSRPGKPSAGHRLDLIATLRAAAPWQAIRRAEAERRSLSGIGVPPTLVPSPRGGGDALGTTGQDLDHRLGADSSAPHFPLAGEDNGGGASPEKTRRLHVRPMDLRIRRHQERTERVIIFAVDASGSAALARLAEAKGAVELLLARAYARRDHVALIAFRGATAEVMLPPTRSLVQTKRRLSGLPGGGGTPLAAALKLATETALRARARGLTPVLVLLTDGRANIALDGAAGRERAEADAAKMARAWRGAGAASVVIDTASRPEAGLRTLAATLGGTYLPLPRADAARMSTALEAALGPVQSG
jgi:magnesium chelatase subunit D